MVKSFDAILEKVKGAPKKTIAVAMAEEDDALMAISHAQREGIADAVLVGDRSTIIECSEKHDIDISHFDIIQANSEQQAVTRSIQLIRGHLADTLMKGKCSTATLLRGVLDKDHGLRSGQLLSHLAAFEVPTYHKLLLLSDAGMNISPDLTEKVIITENAIKAARHLDILKPKVAVIAAVEKVNYISMPCTCDAAILSQMANRGQISNAIIDGPLAFDNAVSEKSCKVKGIDSPVGGDADILIMPDIVAANVCYKSLGYLGQAKTAGIIVGAKVPVILTSRSDSEEAKFLSIALAMITSIR